MSPTKLYCVVRGCLNTATYGGYSYSVGNSYKVGGEELSKLRANEKLSYDDVSRIKKLLIYGVPRFTVSYKFNVTYETIRQIDIGVAHQHVPWPKPPKGAEPR